MPDFGDGSGRDDTFGTVDPYAPSVANGQITPEQWAAYQSKRKKDAILGVLGVLGGTTALGAAGMALGGGTTAASAAPEFGFGAANTGAWTMPPAVGAATGAAGAGAAGAAGGAANTIANVGKTAGGMFGGMDSKDLMSLIAALTATVGAVKSNPPATSPTSATTDPAMAELIALMQGRLRKSEPMFDSVQAMANGLLPTQYQNGGRG